MTRPANDPPEAERPRLLSPVVARSLAQPSTSRESCVIRVDGEVARSSLDVPFMVRELAQGRLVELATSATEAPFFVFRGLDKRDQGRCPACKEPHAWAEPRPDCPWPA